ncbi:hypothetical protein D3C71_1341140 [compost metagenome]
MLWREQVLGLVHNQHVPLLRGSLAERFRCQLRKALRKELVVVRVLRLKLRQQAGVRDELAVECVDMVDLRLRRITFGYEAVAHISGQKLVETEH